ncbi:MAG: hypothetical protein GYA45_10625 [Pelolinea sp.]|jgi:hypothetical protein|nr:hypothetical protein [Pelolinea sp.]
MNKKSGNFLETEYSVVSSYFQQIINFRFITFGFFITAIGFSFAKDNGISKTNNPLSWIIMLFLTIAVWIIEMRNRTLSSSLIHRGKQIEEELYYLGTIQNGNEPFFHMLSKDENTSIEKPRFLGFLFPNIRLWKINKNGSFGKIEFLFNEDKLEEKKEDNKSITVFLFSHSFAIDFMYLLSFVLCIYKLVTLCL